MITDKLLNIHTEEVQIDNHHSYYNHRYEPTSYGVLEQLFSEFPLTASDTFVDYGCGMGRINFYVNHRFHCNSIGIELSEEYYKDAMINLDVFVGKQKERIQFLCMPAQSYLLKGNETCFYFFNPFSVEIFGQVIQNIYDSLQESPRECALILYYPDTDYIYYIENYTGLVLHKIVKVTENQMDARECFYVYYF